MLRVDPSRDAAAFSKVKYAIRGGKIIHSELCAFSVGWRIHEGMPKGKEQPRQGGFMAAPSAGTKIVLQVGEELRIRNNGDLVVDNPELELAGEDRAADAVLYTALTRKRASTSCGCWILWRITSTLRCIAATIEIFCGEKCGSVAPLLHAPYFTR